MAETELDKKLLPAISKVLARVGRKLTWTIPGRTDYDPTEGELVERTADRQTVELESLPPGDYKDYFVEGTVQAADTQTGFAGNKLTITPSLQMQTEIDGVNFRVTQLRPVYSGEKVALWMVNLSRV